MEIQPNDIHRKYMKRCLELASIGAGYVAPNPMVGAVLVIDDKIIGEGYHKKYGHPHAEPNAINSVTNKELLSKCTLYVNLEPCSHYGKTPPCADLIVNSQIPKVVIGTLDPNPKVAGRGVQKLQSAGIEVICGILDEECRELNKRFFTFQEKKRPFVLLKWAQTADGYIDVFRKSMHIPPLKISNAVTGQLTHKMRSENQAILVGTNTVLLDNPTLTVRNWYGKNPVRIALDRQCLIPSEYNIMDDQHPTIIITGQKSGKSGKQTEFVHAEFSNQNPGFILNILNEKNIHSVLVEGGAQVLNCFLNSGLWDEANVEISNQIAGSGVKAPVLDVPFSTSEEFEKHKWIHYKNF